MASPTGTARGCRRKDRGALFVMMSVSAPLRSTVAARRQKSMRWASPQNAPPPAARWKMPPRMPPAWLDRKLTPLDCPFASRRRFSSPDNSAAPKPAPISNALHRVDAHQRRGQLRIELGIDRRAEARRHAFPRSTSITAPIEDPFFLISSR